MLTNLRENRQFFPTHPRVFNTPTEGVPLKLGTCARVRETRMVGLLDGQKSLKTGLAVFSGIDTIPACDKQPAATLP